jgi:thioredoxin reductase (NADPH)
MTLPVLLVVDDDPDVLEDVQDQLAQRYGREYEVVALADPNEAVETLEELRNEGADVALVLAGHSPDRSDDELLDHVRRLHPQAKRALLVAANAWSDETAAEAIRASMALGRIDHYVFRPLASPDEVFHEAVSDFLLEWARERRRVPQTVHIVGEDWSGRAYELRDVFSRCSVPHDFCLADSDQGRELVAKAGAGDAKLPLMILPDGRVLSDPSDAEIAEAAGAPSSLDERTFDVAIVGAGPAGLSAAVYAASEGLHVLVLDAAGIGGQARSSSLIRNYLGFGKGISGSRLAEEAYEQAATFGASFLFLHKVTNLDRSAGWFNLSLSDGRLVHARAVVLAMGATYRRLGVESLEELNGAGVFYGGPASEAPALTGKNVYVVGGGNSAGQAALHLARYAKQVTIAVRAASLETSMSHYLIQAISGAPNVEVRTGIEVVGGGGEGRLQELVLRDRASKEETTVPADALSLLIGVRPQTDWLPADLARDEQGFLLTGDDLGEDSGWPLTRAPLSLETSIPGVIAAGDVRHGSTKRVAAAVGEGSIAAQLVHRLFAAEEDPVPQAIRAS